MLKFTLLYYYIIILLEMQGILQRLEERNELIVNSKADMSLSVITNTNIKKLLDNYPMTNLSIEDCELICKNKMVKNMMSRALETNVGVLTELCKDINKFKKYVETKLKTIKERDRAKKSPIRDLGPELLRGLSSKTLKLFHLPEHIISHITHESFKSLFKSKFKLKKYKLVDGIPAHKLLAFSSIFKNKNALYFLMENKIEIDYYWLASNTNSIAIELLKEELRVNPNVTISWSELSKNPSAFDILNAYKDKIHWRNLSLNTEPKVINLLTNYRTDIDAVKKFARTLSENESPEVIKLLEAELKINPLNIDIDWEKLSRNSKAIEILKANRSKIDWCALSSNTSTEAIKLLEEEMEINPQNRDCINWHNLSGNPNKRAVALLKANPQKIKWSMLSGNTNPEAIKLLEARATLEKTYSDSTYDSIRVHDKINWFKVSSNPSAIELLKDRIIYEDRLIMENRYNRLKKEEKIDWFELSANPSIFTL
jgi:hypothetical protein